MSPRQLLLLPSLVLAWAVPVGPATAAMDIPSQPAIQPTSRPATRPSTGPATRPAAPALKPGERLMRKVVVHRLANGMTFLLAVRRASPTFSASIRFR